MILDLAERKVLLEKDNGNKHNQIFEAYRFHGHELHVVIDFVRLLGIQVNIVDTEKSDVHVQLRNHDDHKLVQDELLRHLIDDLLSLYARYVNSYRYNMQNLSLIRLHQ
jgi:hypothetical protein